MRFICFLVGSGSLIGIMLLIRRILRGRIPPGILYALWLIPAVRLLFPFTLIPVPVLPEAAAEVPAIEEGIDEAGAVHAAVIEYAAGTVRAVIVEYTAGGEHMAVAKNMRYTGPAGIGGMAEAVSVHENREDMQGEAKAGKMTNCLPYIWPAGSILCGCYVILINRRLKRSIKQMQRLPEKRLVPVYIRKEVVSPCLFGLFHPCILLSEQTAKNKELCCQALLHEETHYRQKDHIWTAFRILLCIIYWWNPLVWLGAACAREDAEYACDTRVLKGAGTSEKMAYGYALLEMVQEVQNSRTLIQGITSISGKGKTMKRRLENIVSEHKRTKVWPLPVCLLLLVFLGGFCFPSQKARAEEELFQEPNEETELFPESNREEKMVRESNQEAEIGGGTENAQEGLAGEKETGILLHPQEHREGYREPELRYTASAAWLTDLTDRQEEQEKTEYLARRALRELYDLTGYQAEECFYGYHEIGVLAFARSEEDMEHSRVFYSYSMGEKDGYGIIPSIDIVNARRVWYSDVQQLALPDNAEFMEEEELAVWFLEHSPLCPDGVAVKIEQIFEGGPGYLKVTMEDGTFYEIYTDMEILAVNNIYGPYPEGAQH